MVPTPHSQNQQTVLEAYSRGELSRQAVGDQLGMPIDFEGREVMVSTIGRRALNS